MVHKDKHDLNKVQHGWSVWSRRTWMGSIPFLGWIGITEPSLHVQQQLPALLTIMRLNRHKSSQPQSKTKRVGVIITERGTNSILVTLNLVWQWCQQIKVSTEMVVGHKMYILSCRFPALSSIVKTCELN